VLEISEDLEETFPDVESLEIKESCQFCGSVVMCCYYSPCALGEFLFPRRTLAHQGAPWHIKAHLGTSRCALCFQGAPWEAKAYFGRILHFQGAPWAIFLFPRRTLAHQGAP